VSIRRGPESLVGVRVSANAGGKVRVQVRDDLLVHAGGIAPASTRLEQRCEALGKAERVGIGAAAAATKVVEDLVAECDGALGVARVREVEGVDEERADAEDDLGRPVALDLAGLPEFGEEELRTLVSCLPSWRW
jgi:hypothetical protein